MTLTLKSATPLVTTLALLTLPLPALAQNVITQSTTIRDQLCVGPACLNTETYDSFSATLRLRSFANRIDFIDTDNGLPDTDWQLKANDDNGPARALHVARSDGGYDAGVDPRHRPR